MVVILLQPHWSICLIWPQGILSPDEINGTPNSHNVPNNSVFVVLAIRKSTGNWWILLTKGTVMQSFDVFFVVSLNRLLKKQLSCWRFEMPWGPHGISDLQQLNCFFNNNEAHVTSLSCFSFQEWISDLPVGGGLQSCGTHVKASAKWMAFNVDSAGGGRGQ